MARVMSERVSLPKYIICDIELRDKDGHMYSLDPECRVNAIDSVHGRLLRASTVEKLVIHTNKGTITYVKRGAE